MFTFSDAPANLTSQRLVDGTYSERIAVRSRIRVLLIEDDAEDAHVTSIALRKAEAWSFQVRVVEDLNEAFEALGEEDYDVALLDLGLPGSQGTDTLERFRQHNGSIPVVVLSGHDEEELAIESLEREAQDYLCKSEVNARSLTRAIRHSIQRQMGVSRIQSLLAEAQEKERMLDRKNQRLRELYNTAHSFVDNVSHEFRTPLTIIKEYIALVHDGTMGEILPDQKRFLRIAEDRANDLNAMVDDMLDVSKLGAGIIDAFREPKDICEVVREVYSPLSRKAEVKNIEFGVDIQSHLPTAFCDGEKVARVLINLAINAMKFTRPGGEVRISVKQNGPDIILSVHDTGIGIPPDKVAVIFERFQQVESTLRTATKGFGLGLSIAKELVDLNFGELRVESQLGQGSTFSFTVPCWEPVEISRRYLQHLAKRNVDSLTFVVASAVGDKDELDQVDSFLRYVVRGGDLVFQMAADRWLISVPESPDEASECVERIIEERTYANRNRPTGKLPSIDLQIRETWTDVAMQENEIVTVVKSLIANTRSTGSSHSVTT